MKKKITEFSDPKKVANLLYNCSIELYETFIKGECSVRKLELVIKLVSDFFMLGELPEKRALKMLRTLHAIRTEGLERPSLPRMRIPRVLEDGRSDKYDWKNQYKNREEGKIK